MMWLEMNVFIFMYYHKPGNLYDVSLEKMCIVSQPFRNQNIHCYALSGTGFFNVIDCQKQYVYYFTLRKIIYYYAAL